MHYRKQDKKFNQWCLAQGASERSLVAKLKIKKGGKIADQQLKLEHDQEEMADMPYWKMSGF